MSPLETEPVALPAETGEAPKLEQLSAWRRGKGAGVLDFDSAPTSASRRLVAGGGSVARRPGRPASLEGLKPYQDGEKRRSGGFTLP